MAEDDKNLNAPDTPASGSGNPGGFVMPELKKKAVAPLRPATPAAASQGVDGDDTRTRRTVKLGSVRPARPAEDFPELNPIPSVSAVSTDSGVISDPLSARSAESNGLGVMDDTRTRKTLVIKPLTPKDVKPLSPADLPPPTSSGAPNVLDDTRTRKTVKLAAIVPNGPKVNPATVVEAPTRASEVDDTIKLQRPSPRMMPSGTGAALTPGVGVSLPKSAPAKAVDPSRQTVKLEQMAEAETQPGDAVGDGDDTHTRPVAPVNVSKATIRLQPSDLPGGPQPLQAAASAQASSTDMPPPANSAPTVSLKKPVIPTPAAPVAAPAPAAPAAAAAAAPAEGKRAKKRSLQLEKKAPAEGVKPAEEFDISKLNQTQSSDASKFYTILAVAVLLLTLFSTALTVLQFINLWEPGWVNNQKIEIPVVESWVNK